MPPKSRVAKRLNRVVRPQSTRDVHSRECSALRALSGCAEGQEEREDRDKDQKTNLFHICSHGFEGIWFHRSRLLFEIGVEDLHYPTRKTRPNWLTKGSRIHLTGCPARRILETSLQASDMAIEEHDVTLLLRQWSDGNQQALSELLPVIY